MLSLGMTHYTSDDIPGTAGKTPCGVRPPVLSCVQERRVPKSWQRAADKASSSTDKAAAKLDSSTSSNGAPASS